MADGIHRIGCWYYFPSFVVPVHHFYAILGGRTMPWKVLPYLDNFLLCYFDKAGVARNQHGLHKLILLIHCSCFSLSISQKASCLVTRIGRYDVPLQ